MAAFTSSNPFTQLPLTFSIHTVLVFLLLKTHLIHIRCQYTAQKHFSVRNLGWTTYNLHMEIMLLCKTIYRKKLVGLERGFHFSSYIKTWRLLLFFFFDHTSSSWESPFHKRSGSTQRFSSPQWKWGHAQHFAPFPKGLHFLCRVHRWEFVAGFFFTSLLSPSI